MPLTDWASTGLLDGQWVGHILSPPFGYTAWQPRHVMSETWKSATQPMPWHCSHTNGEPLRMSSTW
jgi:hypothetical protein